jgi:hypothetical protein
VARLPENLCGYIAARTRDIHIQRNYAIKMLLKHRLTYEDLATLQSAIDEGFACGAKIMQCWNSCITTQAKNLILSS